MPLDNYDSLRWLQTLFGSYPVNLPFAYSRDYSNITHIFRYKRYTGQVRVRKTTFQTFRGSSHSLELY